MALRTASIAADDYDPMRPPFDAGYPWSIGAALVGGASLSNGTTLSGHSPLSAHGDLALRLGWGGHRVLLEGGYAWWSFSGDTFSGRPTGVTGHRIGGRIGYGWLFAEGAIEADVAALYGRYRLWNADDGPALLDVSEPAVRLSGLYPFGPMSNWARGVNLLEDAQLIRRRESPALGLLRDLDVDPGRLGQRVGRGGLALDGLVFHRLQHSRPGRQSQVVFGSQLRRQIGAPIMSGEEIGVAVDPLPWACNHRFEGGRQPRLEAMAATVDRPLLLFAFANDRVGDHSSYLRNLPAERRRLRAIFPIEVDRPYDVLFESNITPERLRSLLDRHHGRLIGFHFGGHATGGGLSLETDDGRPDVLRVEGFAGELAALPRLAFVFLNGCSTANHVDALRRAGGPAGSRSH